MSWVFVAVLVTGVFGYHPHPYVAEMYIEEGFTTEMSCKAYDSFTGWNGSVSADAQGKWSSYCVPRENDEQLATCEQLVAKIGETDRIDRMLRAYCATKPEE